MSTKPDTDSPGCDLLYGAAKIAEFLGLSRRSVYHLIESKRIPHFKIGATVCARRSKIDAALDALEESQDRDS